MLFCLQDRFTSVSPATEIVVMTSRRNAKRRHYFDILTHSGEYFRFEIRNEVFEHRTQWGSRRQEISCRLLEYDIF